MAINKINANDTGLAFALEVIGSPGVLPGTAGDGANWYEMEPNSYSDFGADYKHVTRKPITNTRQQIKGNIVDLDAMGGLQADVTQNGLHRLLQCFAFASIRETPSTKGYNTAAVVMTSITGATKTVAAATGLAQFIAKALVLFSNWPQTANNGLKTVASSTAGTLVTVEALVDDVPSNASKIEQVGVAFVAGDVTLTLAAGIAQLNSTAFDFTTLPLGGTSNAAGRFVCVGGDGAAFQFATVKPFIARIKSLTAHAIVFDKTTGPVLADTGAAKTIQMFFGPWLRNEDLPANIVTRSATFQRSLGFDGVGTQSELLIGSFANELTLNIPKADKLTVDLSFVAISYQERTGTLGLLSAIGSSFNAAPGEAPYNTSSNVIRCSIRPIDFTTLNPSPYFGFVSEGKIMIKNNISVLKAVGTLGGFDVSVGDFEVTGTIQAYFTTVGAITAIRQNKDVTWDVIAAQNQTGFAIDMPLIGLGGGKLTVALDQPIMLPLDTAAYKSAFGHTLSLSWFPYLPLAVMPS